MVQSQRRSWATAKQFEADETGEIFDRTFKTIAKHKAQVMKRPGLWYFDKIAGVIVFAIGVALLLLGAVMVILLWDHCRAIAYKGILFFASLGIGCLYIGATLFRRAGKHGAD